MKSFANSLVIGPAFNEIIKIILPGKHVKNQIVSSNITNVLFFFCALTNVLFVNRKIRLQISLHDVFFLKELT